MSGPADHLLRLMYEWIKEAKNCSSNLRGLARELESLRKDGNIAETVCSTVALAASVLSILAAPATGGASLAVGAVTSGLSVGVSVVSKLTEKFLSSSKLERVKEIDKKCNKITNKMQGLFKKLRDECPSSGADEEDKYVMKEILKAIMRRSGLDARIDINDLDLFIGDVIDDALVKTIVKRLASTILTQIISLFSVFSMELGGSLLSAAATVGGKQISKAATIGGASAVFLGVVGLAFSLYESVDNWTEAIRDKHETEASKSLRETAQKIHKTAEKLSDKLSKIEKMLREAIKYHRSKRQPPPDPPSDEEEVSRTRNTVRKPLRLRRSEETELSKTFNSLQLHKPTAQKTSDLNFQVSNQPVRSKTVTISSNKPKTSKSGNNSCQTQSFRSTTSSPSYSPRNDEQEKSSESCSESESSSKGEHELKMALLNARSVNKLIKPKRRELIDLIQGQSLEVLLITETWLKGLTNEAVRMILPPNYNIVSVPRFVGRGGGVAIVYRDDLNCEEIHFESTLTFEYVATAVTMPGSHEPLLILNIYRPPLSNTKEFSNHFLIEFHLLMCDVYARFKYVLIGGDFNIWVDDPDKKAQIFKEIARENHLVQNVLQSTHSKGHILDLVLTRPNVRISDVLVQSNTFSDHSTVLFRAKFRLKKSKSKGKRFRKTE